MGNSHKEPTYESWFCMDSIPHHLKIHCCIRYSALIVQYGAFRHYHVVSCRGIFLPYEAGARVQAWPAAYGPLPEPGPVRSVILACSKITNGPEGRKPGPRAAVDMRRCHAKRLICCMRLSLFLRGDTGLLLTFIFTDQDFILP
jgi:hypothetical protein